MKTVKIFSLIFIVLFTISTNSCHRNEKCEYQECTPTCKLFQDFESFPIGNAGNWKAINLDGLSVENQSGSKKLKMVDASGGSNAYNEIDFPKNLAAAGCELVYDVEYIAGSSNLNTTSNSIGIYQGSFATLSFTSRAYFKLKAPNLIVDGNPAKIIKVPLKLASGTTLPSNAYGDWILVGGSSPTTATDVANFNALITNISGVYFPVDSGSNPAEIWYYDNFCFTQCCY